MAEILGTTASNVSAVERAAQEHITKVRQTLELVRVLRAPNWFTDEAGVDLDAIVERLYVSGDDRVISLGYRSRNSIRICLPRLEVCVKNGQLTRPVELGSTGGGVVGVYSERAGL